MLESSSEPTHKGVVALAIILVLGAVAGGYTVAHEHSNAQNLAAQNRDLAAENQQSATALDATRQQVSDLAAKVNTLAARNEAPAATSSGTAAGSRSSTARRIPRDDPRFKKLQSQLDAQGQAIDQARTDLASTQGDLSNARTELTGSIAHTHDELITLEKRGQRSYTEFDLPKSKQFQREGPIQIRVRKADNKHQFADLDLLVDDRNLTQKHVNLYQPVMYSTPDTPQPVEVVINSVTKDHIHGYVSASKYRQSELASMASASADDSSGQGSNSAAQGSDQNQNANQTPASGNSNSQPSQRQKLPSPM